MNDDLLKFLYQNKESLLDLSIKDFQSKNLQPAIGIELEFYLTKNQLPTDTKLVEHFILQLKLQLEQQNINILAIEPEQGLGQIEIKTNPCQNILLLCKDILKIKNITQQLAQNYLLEANFSSQPFQNDCSSALQINFSLMDNKNNYLFAGNVGQESNFLLWSIAGILTFTKNIILISAPQESDYQRFDLNLNRNLHKNKKYTAPVNISWGYNNRTALVRIPTTQKDEQRRLEFRLPSANADIYLTIFSLLITTKLGITHEQLPPPEIYGNAFDEQYNLEPLAFNYKTAGKDFFNHDLLLKTLQK